MLCYQTEATTLPLWVLTDMKHHHRRPENSVQDEEAELSNARDAIDDWFRADSTLYSSIYFITAALIWRGPGTTDSQRQRSYLTAWSMDEFDICSLVLVRLTLLPHHSHFHTSQDPFCHST